MLSQNHSLRLCALVSLLACAAHSRAALPELGILGDSLSDEYTEASYGAYAQNWPIQLVDYRGIDLGPTAAEAGQPGNTWGEPRRRGYQQNWARAGATTSSVLSSGQHTGLTAMIPTHGIAHALLVIGANDFAPGSSAYNSIYSGSWSAAQIQNYVDGRLANVNTALDTVLPTGVNFILASFPDYSVAPSVEASYPNAAQRELVTTVIAGINSQLEQIAADRHIVFADLFAFSKTAFGTNAAPINSVTVGGNVINLNGAGVAGANGFVGDGIHPHTVLQGMLANLFLEGFNTGYKANVPLFSEAELVAHAGLPYSADTLPAALADMAPFIHSYVPQDGDANGDGAIDGADYTIWADHFQDTGKGFARGDFTGDTIVDGADYTIWADNFSSGEALAIPEPASILLAALGALALVALARQRG
ncbi:MAG: PEP-CTERM sorting domain-containing protein [Pirellulales bacterium]|nr:PEP-CTERM sorting domain-containing protein [Pirellulales bacterium]